MSNLAIIPARGGSKRIPGKNIKDFLGKPIIAYSIQAALDSKLFDEVMVSTDDDEIAEVALKYGAKIPFMRSSNNSGDHSTIVDVLEEVVGNYDNIENICCILPTAPLVSSRAIRDAYELLLTGYTAVYPVVKFAYPIMRALILDENNKVKFKWPEFLNTRSQDIQDAYHDSGSFYWVNKEALLIEKSVLTQSCSAIVIDEMNAQDIDTESDWIMAEMKYKFLHGQNN